jgi:hypothetical protein
LKIPLKNEKGAKQKEERTTLRHELERINLKASSMQTTNKHIAQSEAHFT